MTIQLHDEIADLFNVNPNGTLLWLIERYKVAISSDEVNGILAALHVGGRKIPRIEVLCMDSSEHLIVIVDGVITVSVHMSGFEQFAGFVAQMSLPLN